MQGGDYESGDGYGGASVCGQPFPDENFEEKHDKKGKCKVMNRLSIDRLNSPGP